MNGALALAKLGLSRSCSVQESSRGARHFACSVIGVFFMCKKQQLGDPNELGAQQEIV